MELRPYQKKAVDAVYNHLRSRDDNPCVVLPTGTGKSVVIAKIVDDAVSRWNGRVIILAHVKELLEQNAGKIRAFCPDIPIGIYSAGLKSRDTRENVIVAGIQSVYDKACELGPFDIVIVDEARGARSSSTRFFTSRWMVFWERLKTPASSSLRRSLSSIGKLGYRPSCIRCSRHPVRIWACWLTGIGQYTVIG